MTDAGLKAVLGNAEREVERRYTLGRPVRIQQLLEDAEREVEWSVEGLIPKASKVLLSGDPKSGKTWLLLELLLSKAAGSRAFGRFQAEPAPVLGIFAEDGARSLGRRVSMLAVGKGIDPTVLDAFFWIRPGFLLEDEAHQAELEAVVREHGIGTVGIDTFTETFTGNENAAQDVKAALMPLSRLRDRTGCTVILTHHNRKPSDADMGRRRSVRIRGSGYLRGWYDVGLQLDVARPDAPISVEVETREVSPPSPFLLEREGGGEAIAFRHRRAHSPDLAIHEAAVAIVDALRRQPGLTKTGIREEVGGKAEVADQAVQALVQAGSVRVRVNGRAHLH